MIIHILFLLIGVGLLYWGGELLVSRTSSLARRVGLSTVTIALTVVAFGTSAPELAASISAALKGSPEIALGNVVGSNLFNLGLILGITALIRPMAVSRHFVKMEIPFLAIITIVMAVMAWHGSIGRFQGGILLILLMCYIYMTFKMTKKAKDRKNCDMSKVSKKEILLDLAGIFGGIALLVAGANFMIEGAIYMARSLGLGERVIGMTIVAFGTSLPEFASCVIATSKGDSGFILGNLIGSNIFNILAIIGLTVQVRPMLFNGSLFHVDLLALSVLTLILGYFLYTGYRLSRREGLCLVCFYCLYFFKIIM